MVLHRDVVQVEARLDSFGDNVNLDATQVHSFALNVKYAWKSYWLHPIELLGDVGQEEACFHLFGDCVNLGARYVLGLR
jgi:hypothetical protein